MLIPRNPAALASWLQTRLPGWRTMEHDLVAGAIAEAGLPASKLGTVFALRLILSRPESLDIWREVSMVIETLAGGAPSPGYLILPAVEHIAIAYRVFRSLGLPENPSDSVRAAIGAACSHVGLVVFPWTSPSVVLGADPCQGLGTPATVELAHKVEARFKAGERADAEKIDHLDSTQAQLSHLTAIDAYVDAFLADTP